MDSATKISGLKIEGRQPWNPRPPILHSRGTKTALFAPLKMVKKVSVGPFHRHYFYITPTAATIIPQQWKSSEPFKKSGGECEDRQEKMLTFARW